MSLSVCHSLSNVTFYVVGKNNRNEWNILHLVVKKKKKINNNSTFDVSKTLDFSFIMLIVCIRIE